MSDGNTHWCYQCRQPVRRRGRNSVCSRCSGGFVQELNEVVVNGQRNLGPFDASDYRFMDPFTETRYRLWNAFAEAMGQANLGIRSSMVPEGGIDQALARMSGNDGFECFFNGVPVGSRHSNASNSFRRTSFQELLQQIMANDGIGRQGPPPATRSAIDSLPTIRIANRHLNTDSHCPICQDRFDLGSEARMMPCNHIYHSGCILPWLRQHNSCPVCRRELPSQGTNGGSSSGSNSRGTEDSDQNQGRRNRLPFLWRFLS